MSDLKRCPCPTCATLDGLIEEAAFNLERLAFDKSIPIHVSQQLHLCARTVRRGLYMPSAEHKVVALQDYETLLINVMASVSYRAAHFDIAPN